MNGKFTINKSEVLYLIHGQSFSIEYETEGCFFTIFLYNNGGSFFNKISIKKSNGVFTSVTNVYSPTISVWGVGWRIKKIFQYCFKINFFNARTQLVKPITPQLDSLPSIKVTKLNPIFQPNYIKLYVSQPFLKSNQLTVQSYDDYSALKSKEQSI